MSIDSLPAIPKTLAEYAETRDRILSLREQAGKLLDMAKDEAAGLAQYCWPYEGGLSLSADEFRKRLDRDLWRASFNLTGFMQIMDGEAKNQFQDSLREKPPEFTVDNIRSIFLTLHQDADAMFKRGIVNTFKRFSPEHKTNKREPFKIGKRCVLSYVFSNSWQGYPQVREYSNGMINDIDRVFRVLDGKKHTERALESAINGAMKAGETYEDEYFKVRGFKNGNGHIDFKRLDLVDKVNDIIAEHYGDNTLANGRAAA
jgi:hypothetical protein